jgi:hypothetical protein
MLSRSSYEEHMSSARLYEKELNEFIDNLRAGASSEERKGS